MGFEVSINVTFTTIHIDLMTNYQLFPCSIVWIFIINTTKYTLVLPRLQCPILKDNIKWEDLSEDRKDELREEYGVTADDELWRGDGSRHSVFVNKPPGTITGMAILVLW